VIAAVVEHRILTLLCEVVAADFVRGWKAMYIALMSVRARLGRWVIRCMRLKRGPGKEIMFELAPGF
jgi:hypothetical protein